MGRPSRRAAPKPPAGLAFSTPLMGLPSLPPLFSPAFPSLLRSTVFSPLPFPAPLPSPGGTGPGAKEPHPGHVRPPPSQAARGPGQGTSRPQLESASPPPSQSPLLQPVSATGPTRHQHHQGSPTNGTNLQRPMRTRTPRGWGGAPTTGAYAPPGRGGSVYALVVAGSPPAGGRPRTRCAVNCSIRPVACSPPPPAQGSPLNLRGHFARTRGLWRRRPLFRMAGLRAPRPRHLDLHAFFYPFLVCMMLVL